MNFHVLTLFPDMINTVARTSIMGRAISSGAVGLNVINIRDFSIHNTKRVDDYPYGGGAGMVMEPEPIFQAVTAAKQAAGKEAKVIYLTPAAKVLDQLKAEELAKEQDLILLCGHYEGIDDRVLEEVVDENISIGDYVLTGGELGACVLMDAVSRFVPGVLHNDESSLVESHQDNLLEYPQYTRPEVWHDQAVPKVLLSGDHKKIEAWRHEQSLERTKKRRPDLFEKSYKVNVLYFGSEEAEKFAFELGGGVSRYPVFLDYNRAKLVKQKRTFGASDLLVVVTDDPGKAGTALEKVSGHMSLLVFIGLTEKTENAERKAEGEPDETVLPADMNERPQGFENSSFEQEDLRFLKMLEDKGFRILKSTAACRDLDEEQVSALALEIRKKMDETEK